MSSSMPRKVLYMPSTPLNLLLSVAHAFAYGSKQRARLVLIDQRNEQGSIYFDALMSLKDSPFEKVDLILGQAKGADKLKERKGNFSRLDALVSDFVPDAIAVGSDRRIEFQYLMHRLEKSGKNAEGWYLDDGLYSYAGRPYKWFKDEINKLVKKLIYGLWWQEPETVGASDWIKKAWLFRPEHAVEALKTKRMHEIESEWFTNVAVKDFSRHVCRVYGLEQLMLDSLEKVGILLLVPHPNNIKKMVGYEDRLHKFLKELDRLGITVAIKYHPRMEQRDQLGLERRYGALLIPAGLAFEFVLPFLRSDTVVVGDVGTALLTAQWLRPDLNVNAVLAEDDSFQSGFRAIYELLGVNIVSDFRDVSVSKEVSKKGAL